MVQLLNLLFTLLYVTIIARVILSFVIPMMGRRSHPALDGVARVVYLITEPILAPIRRVLPTFGAVDFSPTVAILILVVIQYILATRL